MSDQIPLSQLKRVAELDAEDARQIKLLLAVAVEALEMMLDHPTHDHAFYTPEDARKAAEGAIQKAKEIL